MVHKHNNFIYTVVPDTVSLYPRCYCYCPWDNGTSLILNAGESFTKARKWK